ncbi:MAG: class I adenylate-forming enzyme family protein [Gammaproteobacteria bacterium]
MYELELSESHCAPVAVGEIRDVTVGELLREAAARAPGRTGLKEMTLAGDIDRSWTYAELLADSERLARALLGRHRPGERIAVWAYNTPEWVLLEMAAALAGLTLVTVNPSFQPREVHYVLEQSGAVALYTVEQYRGNPMMDIARQVAGGLPAVRTVIDILDHDALFDGADANVALPEVAPLDPAQIQYTSGTTGFPKGAVLHHRGLVNSAFLHHERLGFREGDVYLNFMPLFHTGGCAVGNLGTLSMAGTLIIAAIFDPGAVNQVIAAEKVTHLVGVPTMLVALIKAQQGNPVDLSSVRGISSGGSMVAPELVRQTEATFGCMPQIIYGQTETSPMLTMMWRDDSLEDATRTVGQPVPHTEMAILDPETRAVKPVGEIGEICARGYMIMLGYNDNPEATAATIDEDGWLHTGDLGTMDARGYVTVTGRLKEMIIRGGENLFPAEIENAMLEHPDISEAAVVGIPDERWGEVVACFLRADGHRPPREDLVRFCRERLSPQKTPAHWVYVKDWPLTGSGKIQKFVLRDQFVEGQHEPV